jgi:hypothetical protein
VLIGQDRSFFLPSPLPYRCPGRKAGKRVTRLTGEPARFAFLFVLSSLPQIRPFVFLDCLRAGGASENKGESVSTKI